MIESLITGLLIGARHSFEPDHIAGITTIKSNLQIASLLWAFGHTTIVLVAGLLFFSMEINISKMLGVNPEILVGIMLIVIAIFTIKNHEHLHTHGLKLHYHKHDTSHHKKSYVMGLVHGLAGSGSLIIFFATDFLWLVLFAVGMIFTMSIFGIVLSRIIARYNIQNLNYIMAGVSIGIGTLFIYNNVPIFN